MKRYTTISLCALILAAWAVSGSFCSDNATGLAPGQPVSGQIRNAGDEVSYQVTLTGGKQYTFSLSVDSVPDGGMAAPKLTLVEASGGRTLATASNGLSFGLTLVYPAASTVDAYLTVGSDQNGFAYTITMEEQSTGVADAGTADAGPVDAGLDAGRDAGHRDAGSADASEDDGGGDAGDGGSSACNASNCLSGCCDTTGLCRPGTGDDLCGKNGAVCEDCIGNGATCVNNACATCSSVSCPSGCCDKTGACKTGDTATACGKKGAACIDCSLNSGTCKSNVCSYTCNASTCSTGCCDPQGNCVTSQNDQTCGLNGEACKNCTQTTDKVCSGNACKACDGTSCPNGCCDQTNACLPGTANNNCGKGSTCVDCTTIPGTCNGTTKQCQ